MTVEHRLQGQPEGSEAAHSCDETCAELKRRWKTFPDALGRGEMGQYCCWPTAGVECQGQRRGRLRTVRPAALQHARVRLSGGTPVDMLQCESESVGRSVVSDSLRPRGL